MKKILSMKYPMIRCYPHHANFLASVILNDFDFGEILPNYIQLVYNQDINRIDFNWGMDILGFIKNQPYVDLYCYERKIIKHNWKNYRIFVEEMIDNDKYVQLLVDTYYVPSYKDWYMKTHILHDMTIYGYDNENFYIADCFQKGKYSFEKIPKKVIDIAQINENEYDWLDGVHCWSPKKDVYLCLSINVNNVKKMLKEYINHIKCESPTVIERLRRKSFLYGVNVYDGIIKYVQTIEEYLDLRIPYVLVEQKKILTYICERLNQEYKIRNFEENMIRLKEIEKSTILIQNYFIKYNMYKDIMNNKGNGNYEDKSIKLNGIKNELIGHLQKIKQSEIEELMKFVDDISIRTLFNKKQFSYKGKDSFFNVDSETHGNWKEKYGTKGYFIIGDDINLPDSIKIYNSNCLYVSVFRNDSDSRALSRAKNNNRMLAYYLNNKEFNLEIQVIEKIKISIYFVDYDRLERAEKIYVQLKKTGTVLFVYELRDFEKGKYISFTSDEDVIISFNLLEGPDAVVSGIFFD